MNISVMADIARQSYLTAMSRIESVSGLEYQFKSVKDLVEALRSAAINEYAAYQDELDFIKTQPENDNEKLESLFQLEHEFSRITGYADFLKNASLNSAPWWARAVVLDCAESLGLDVSKEEVLMVACPDTLGFHVTPEAGKAKVSRTAYFCPLEIHSSPLLCGLLLHEVGHIWFERAVDEKTQANLIKRDIDERYGKEVDEAKQKLYRETAVDDGEIHFRSKDEYSVGVLFDSCLEYLFEEFLCDHLARVVGGPAYDIAYTVDLLRRNPMGITMSHPSDFSRTSRGLAHVKELIDQHKKVAGAGVEGTPFDLLAETLESVIGVAYESRNSVDRDTEGEKSHSVEDLPIDRLREVLRAAAATAEDLLEKWLLDVNSTKRTNAPTLRAMRKKWKLISPFSMDPFVKDYDNAKTIARTPIPLFEIFPKSDVQGANSAGLGRALSALEIVAYVGLAYIGNTEPIRLPEELDDDSPAAMGIAESRRLQLGDAMREHLKAAVDICRSVRAAYKIANKEDGQPLDFVLKRSDIYKPAEVRNPMIVTPILAPNEQCKAGSVDLRLGTTFLQLRSERVGALDPRREFRELNESNPISESQWDGAFAGRATTGHYDLMYHSIGDEFILHPHQFVLATVLEYLVMPNNKYANVLGRSSWGRLGLTIATATAVGPYYKGRLTLELKNVGTSPITIPVGSRVAQLFFTKLDTEASYHGKYRGPVDAEAPKLNRDGDWELLAQMQQKTRHGLRE